MTIKIGFKYRVALMAALLSAATLFIVVWLIQSRIHEIRQQQSLTELCLQVRRMALVVRPASPLENMELGQIARLKIDTRNDYLMHWINYTDGKVWKSSAWPVELDTAKLKWNVVPVTKDDEIMTVKGQAADVECRRSNFSIANKQRYGSWMAVEANTPEGYGFAAINLQSIVRSTWAAIMQPVVTLVAPIALLLSVFSAWMLSLYVTRPINRLGSAMSSVSSGLKIDKLSSKGAAPEFQRLIDLYNGMAQRLKKNYEQISRFSADAAHELKTPLTIMQGQIEHALVNPEKADRDEVLLELQAQVSNLSAITRKLLLLSQADAGHLALDKKNINWSLLLKSALEDVSILVKAQQISSAIEADLKVYGDEIMLKQVCINILANALQHGLPHGRVAISAHAMNEGIETLITNESELISQADRQSFFSRFYRRDEVRKNGISGSGLGLSLAQKIAEAHGGALTLQPSDERLVVIRLWLPSH